MDLFAMQQLTVRRVRSGSFASFRACVGHCRYDFNFEHSAAPRQMSKRAIKRHRRMPQLRELLQLEGSPGEDRRIFATRGAGHAPLPVWWRNGGC
jgi:hypothetical protein